MNVTVAQLTARSLLGRRHLALLLLLPAVLLLLLCVAARLLAGPNQDVSVGLLGGFALGAVVPLLALIVGAGAIGPEIDDGSIVYLLSKPLSRFAIVNSKLAVAVAVVIAAAAVPTLLAGLVLSRTADGLAVGYGVGAAVAGIAYCTPVPAVGGPDPQRRGSSRSLIDRLMPHATETRGRSRWPPKAMVSRLLRSRRAQRGARAFLDLGAVRDRWTLAPPRPDQ